MGRLKKVLRVTTRLNVGGPSKQILTLNSLFAGDKYKQIIVAGRVLDSEIEIDLSEFEKVIKLDALRRGLNPLNDLKTIMQLISQAQALLPQPTMQVLLPQGHI